MSERETEAGRTLARSPVPIPIVRRSSQVSTLFACHLACHPTYRMAQIGHVAARATITIAGEHQRLAPTGLARVLWNTD